jgi:hypothetical protein
MAEFALGLMKMDGYVPWGEWLAHDMWCFMMSGTSRLTNATWDALIEMTLVDRISGTLMREG